MNFILLLYSTLVYIFFASERILIDVNKVSKLKISEIAEKIITIPIKIPGFKSIGIEKVFLNDNEVFVLQRYQEDDVHYSHVYKFDISGNLVTELSLKDRALTSLNIIDMLLDNINKQIFLFYPDGYAIFDIKGNYLGFKHAPKPILSHFIFNEHHWFVENSNQNDIADYSLVYSDLSGQNKDTLKSLKIKLPDSFRNTGIGIFSRPTFSVHNNELFFSFGIDNVIYKMSQSRISPQFNFEFKNRPSSDTDVFGAPGQLVFSHYVKFGYRTGAFSYDFLFDIESGKSYNLRYRWENNVAVSGIFDDINNTGYFDLRLTNNEDYIYFFKKPEELIRSTKSSSDNSYPTLFLVRVK